MCLVGEGWGKVARVGPNPVNLYPCLGHLNPPFRVHSEMSHAPSITFFRVFTKKSSSG